MKKILLPGLLSISLLILSVFTLAQTPEVAWDKFLPLPGEYESGNYTVHEILESHEKEGSVLIGSRNMSWKGNGYREVVIMRIDHQGNSIDMDETFTGTIIDDIYEDGVWVTDTIPWDQEAYDMVLTRAEDNRYLLTGFRDTTLLTADSPPGLFLMELRGDGRVAFDSLYHNNNNDWIMGRCIQPDLEGGYIIAGSIMEDGSGPDQIMMTRVRKDESDRYHVVSTPYIKINPIGENGYASWVRTFGEGYLVAGTARRSNTANDIFIQRVDADLYPDCDDCFTAFYGGVETDEFADAMLSGDTIYLTGSSPDPDSRRYQIYVVKAAADGTVIWEKTYGGNTTLFAQSIMRTGDGNLLVAGNASVGGYSQMRLLKIDAATGDSIWMQSYGSSFRNAGIRDAFRSSDFNYVAAGRASYTTAQDPHIYVMKLDNPSEANHFVAREGLDLEIVPGTPTKDVAVVSAGQVEFLGIMVSIDSLFHPSVGDLEITLEHGGTTVTLVNQPRNSGENFIHTAFIDAAEVSLDLRFAPYTGWFLPEEALFPFLLHDPSGEWTLTITDHGTGGMKSTSMLSDWNLNLLVNTESGVGIPSMEELANFGLEPIRPNPVSQEAHITFQIPKSGVVNLKVYNQLGQEVASLAREDLPPGMHTRVWNPGSLAPGIYFFHLEMAGMISVRKAMIAK